MESEDSDDTSNNVNKLGQVIPFKKAKFSWQVKGRSRSQIEESSCSSSNSTPLINECFARNIDRDLPVGCSSNLNNRNASGKRFSEPAISTPCYVENHNSNSSVPSLRASACLADRADDRGLARWQARQVAKGFVDNTINRVLDSFTEAPMPGHTGSLVVEDAAILMAISAHGLQNGAGPVDQTPQAGGTHDWQQPGSSGRELRRVSESPQAIGEHYDFLEAAVSVAIQKKGLAPLSHNS
uniref:Putative product n=1 Tax=Xenopsylla cheopis TaxID=163159 RepID=A0A6M2DK97_XENCH